MPMSTASARWLPTFATSPRNPMSAIWGWAQLAEHPEKCMRMMPASSAGPDRSPGTGVAPTGSPANCSSRNRAHLTARSLVSTMA